MAEKSRTAVPLLDTFGARLALIRHHHGWNQKEAAMACGLPHQSWRNWEAGKLPRDYMGVCRAIAEHARVDLNWLVYGPEGAQGITRDNESSNWLRFARTA